MTFSTIEDKVTGDELERRDPVLREVFLSKWLGAPWRAQNLLEFQLPGELILGLLQLLALLDVLLLEVMDLCLHCLQLGEELEPRGEADGEGGPPDNELSLPPSLKTPLPGPVPFIPF